MVPMFWDQKYEMIDVFLLYIRIHYSNQLQNPVHL